MRDHSEEASLYAMLENVKYINTELNTCGTWKSFTLPEFYIYYYTV